MAQTLSKTQKTELTRVRDNNGRLPLGRTTKATYSGKIAVTHKSLLRMGALKQSGNLVLMTEKGRELLGN